MLRTMILARPTTNVSGQRWSMSHISPSSTKTRKILAQFSLYKTCRLFYWNYHIPGKQSNDFYPGCNNQENLLWLHPDMNLTTTEHNFVLPKTNSSPLKIGQAPKGNESSEPTIGIFRCKLATATSCVENQRDFPLKIPILKDPRGHAVVGLQGIGHASCTDACPEFLESSES